jgi:membrane protease YdiL (CAAX protease family)
VSTLPSAVHWEEPTRRTLVTETRAVMVVFLVPGIVSAVTLFVRHVLTGSSPDPFAATVPGNQLASMLTGILDYLAVAAPVPVALVLLRRTGQRARDIGLGTSGLRTDLWPAVGLALAALGTNVLVAAPFAPLLHAHAKLAAPVAVNHVPAYYVAWGLVLSATTAVAEEVLVNGYLLVRLNQLGWTPRGALVLSLSLRTSYHVYYGLAFLFTIPFGYYVTRSFQKHGRLTRPIAAHFFYDALLTTVTILNA